MLRISHIASAALETRRDWLRRRRRPEAAEADSDFQTHRVAAVGRREEGEHRGHARLRLRRYRRGAIGAETRRADERETKIGGNRKRRS